MIPIRDLEYGKHVLAFGINPELLDKIVKDKSLDQRQADDIKEEFSTPAVIPFWKDVSK